VRGRIVVRLVAPYLGVVCACILFVGLPLHLMLRRDYVANAATVFNHRVARVEPEIARAAARADRAALDALCARLNAAFQGRVSIFAADGDLLGDAIGMQYIRPGTPESVERIRGAAGSSSQRKNLHIPLRPDTLTLTARLDLGRGGPGIARLALPLRPLYDQMRGIHLLLLLGTAGAVALAIVVGLSLVRGIARPLVRVTRAAEDIAAGDFESSARVRGHDEISRLAGAVNTMRRNLQTNLATLARERNQVLAIVQNMAEGVLALGPNNEVQLFNAPIARMLGLEGRLRIGAMFNDFGADPRAGACVRQARETGNVASVELGDLEAGERVIVLAAGPVARDEAEVGEREPHEQAVVILAHDATESRRVESMHRELVANMSHELRTPLSTISSTAGTLLAGPAAGDPQNRAFLETIARQAERMRSLVENTLSLCRLDTLASPLKTRTLDAWDLVAEAADAVANEIETRGQHLDIDVPADCPPVEGDGRLLSQALRNLIENASRYTPAGGRISVRVCAQQASVEQEGEVAFEVSDAGPGIAPEDQARVFDRFFRGRREPEGDVQGAGLGLSIVRRVAQAHRGSATLSSKRGQGSVFILSIPSHRAPESDT